MWATLMQFFNLFDALIVTLFSSFNLDHYFTTCSERVKNVYPKNVYQTQKTLLDKLDSFGIDNTNEQTLFNNLAIFDFESICVQEDNLKDTHTTKWIGEQISISVFISSILVKEPIFFATLIFIISLLLLSVLLTN